MVQSRNGAPERRHGSKASRETEEIEATQSINQESKESFNSSQASGIDLFLKRLDDLNLSKKNLDESNGVSYEEDIGNSSRNSIRNSITASSQSPPLIKVIAVIAVTLLVLVILYDTVSSPEKQLLGTNRIHEFLFWVKENPKSGAAAFIVVYASCVILLLPGTPLTLGGGYVYKVTYGWTRGIAVGTIISTTGSLVGSCTCFILGRYIMRDRVRKWGKKYPLFEAVDIAVSDNGFKIMCLLYLTPILPLGPVSYMCGTTSMPLLNFAAAKVAALPLMFLYVFIGASTDMLITGSTGSEESDIIAVKKMSIDEDTHRKMILFGLCLSAVSMSLVSHFVKRELYRIFDKQKHEKDKNELSGPALAVEGSVELTPRTETLSRRPRGQNLEVGSHIEE